MKYFNNKDEVLMSEFNNVSGDHLKQFIERIEKLEEEKANILNDIKEVYSEAKGTGFDIKIIRQIIRIRKMDKAKHEEEEELIALYLDAISQ